MNIPGGRNTQHNKPIINLFEEFAIIAVLTLDGIFIWWVYIPLLLEGIS